MGLFLAELDLQDATPAQLAAFRVALDEASRRLTEGGLSVRLEGALFVPGRGCCLCLLSAPSVPLARRAIEIAQGFTLHVEAVVELP